MFFPKQFLFWALFSLSASSMNEFEQLQDNHIFQFNIGGHEFDTTYETIRNFGGEYLNALLTGRFKIVKDKNGRIFIDRPRKEGEFIDYFIRTQQLPDTLDKTVAINAGEYFGINYTESTLNSSQIKYIQDCLFIAIANGIPEEVEWLLKFNVDLTFDGYDAFEFRKEFSFLKRHQPLALAAADGYYEIVEMLLAAGTNPNIRTRQQVSLPPLVHAVQNGRYEIVKLLLERGADPNFRSKTMNSVAINHIPLTNGQITVHLNILKILLEKGADPTIEADYKSFFEGAASRFKKVHQEVMRIAESLGYDFERKMLPTITPGSGPGIAGL